MKAKILMLLMIMAVIGTLCGCGSNETVTEYNNEIHDDYVVDETEEKTSERIEFTWVITGDSIISDVMEGNNIAESYLIFCWDDEYLAMSNDNGGATEHYEMTLTSSVDKLVQTETGWIKAINKEGKIVLSDYGQNEYIIEDDTVKYAFIGRSGSQGEIPWKFHQIDGKWYLSRDGKRDSDDKYELGFILGDDMKDSGIEIEEDAIVSMDIKELFLLGNGNINIITSDGSLYSMTYTKEPNVTIIGQKAYLCKASKTAKATDVEHYVVDTMNDVLYTKKGNSQIYRDDEVVMSLPEGYTLQDVKKVIDGSLDLVQMQDNTVYTGSDYMNLTYDEELTKLVQSGDIVKFVGQRWDQEIGVLLSDGTFRKILPR